MPAPKATPHRGQISAARVVPLHIETAKQFGGGARGRTLALIYRQLCYWSKYAKWKGKNGKRMFYKSQRELADELGYSEKTINRAIKALRELGLVVVEQLHKRYWRQVYFYYLPHSPFAAAEPAPPAPAEPAPEPSVSAPDASVMGCSTTTKPSSLNAPAGAGGAVHPAAKAAAASIKSKGGGGFGQNVRMQQREYKPLIKQSLQAVVERCNAIGKYLKQEQEGMVPIS
jgi:hypothetical protein